MREQPRKPEWYEWATGETPTVLDVWDGAPSLFLAPTSRGAIVWWEFDQGPDDSRYIFLAHLTDHEAQAVFDASPGVGAIEPVRAQLHDDRAIVARRHPAGYESERLVRIPRDGSEQAFAKLLEDVRDELARDIVPKAARGGASRSPGAPSRRRKKSTLDNLARLASTA